MALPNRKAFSASMPQNPTKSVVRAPAPKAAPVATKAPAPKPAPVAAKAPAPKPAPVAAKAPAPKAAPTAAKAPAPKPKAVAAKAPAPNRNAFRAAAPQNPSKIFRDRESVAAGDPRTGPNNNAPVNSSRTSVAATKTPAQKKPNIEDPALPPTDGTGGGTTAPTPTAAKAESGPIPTDWAGIVNHFFPRGGTGYKDGGMVRGGGCAAKGFGRGKIV